MGPLSIPGFASGRGCLSKWTDTTRASLTDIDKLSSTLAHIGVDYGAPMGEKNHIFDIVSTCLGFRIAKGFSHLFISTHRPQPRGTYAHPETLCAESLLQRPRNHCPHSPF